VIRLYIYSCYSMLFVEMVVLFLWFVDFLAILRIEKGHRHRCDGIARLAILLGTNNLPISNILFLIRYPFIFVPLPGEGYTLDWNSIRSKTKQLRPIFALYLFGISNWNTFILFILILIMIFNFDIVIM